MDESPITRSELDRIIQQRSEGVIAWTTFFSLVCSLMVAELVGLALPWKQLRGDTITGWGMHDMDGGVLVAIGVVLLGLGLVAAVSATIERRPRAVAACAIFATARAIVFIIALKQSNSSVWVTVHGAALTVWLAVAVALASWWFLQVDR